MDSGRSARAARRLATYEGGVVSFDEERYADFRFWHAGADEVRLNAVLEMALARIPDGDPRRLSRSIGGVRQRER
ncbi:MAG TPA: hypothetical protein PK156_27355 [Polyangium sp.]|nr:hypothetical protein [Polyangium sp.]